MRNLGLLLSLVLSVYGLYSIVTTNFFGIAFDWEDLIFYLVIAVIIYIITRLVGVSLDKKFNATVEKFLKGDTPELLPKKGLLRTFGLLLITLFPYLIYLQLFALFAAIMFVLYAFVFVTDLPEVPIALLIGLGLVLLGTTFAVLVGFYRLFFPKKRKTYGLEISKNEQLGLWELVAEVGRNINAKPINKIIITLESGIGVYLEGNVFITIFGGGKRVLEIGLPSIRNLTVDEFKAILAHEYGHFSNADTQWGAFTFMMGNSLVNTLHSIPMPSKNGKSGWIGLVMILNPAYWILLLYVNLYFRVTKGFSRIREVMADIRAMKLYGGRAFGNGLFKVATNDSLFNEIIFPAWIPNSQAGYKALKNYSESMNMAYESTDKSTVDLVKNNLIANSQKHEAFDSHPALNVRIEYAKKFDQLAEKDGRSIDTVFSEWDALNQKMAEMFNTRISGYIKTLPEEVVVEVQQNNPSI